MNSYVRFASMITRTAVAVCTPEQLRVLHAHHASNLERMAIKADCGMRSVISANELRLMACRARSAS